MSDLRLTKALADVADERQRQIAREGWTEEHDDAHRRGELSFAAACYAANAATDLRTPPRSEAIRLKCSAIPPYHMWPWDISWWKPRSPREDLVRAAALILAEIERIDRIAE